MWLRANGRSAGTVVVLSIVLATLGGFGPAIAEAQDTITTIAGDGPNNTSATLAALVSPLGVVVDKSGKVYIAAYSANRVYRVDASGQLTVYAGNGAYFFSGDGGPADAASLRYPAGLALDGSGNLFICDSANGRMRRVDVVRRTITTVAGGGRGGDGGPATAAHVGPDGVALDGAGNIFIADGQFNRIWRVDATTGIITTVAGNGTQGFSGDGGPGTSAELNAPTDAKLDRGGNLFIVDQTNNRIRRVDAVTGIISTVAGTGTPGVAGFGGDGGPATMAYLNTPGGVAVDSAGNLFISDSGNHRVRRVDATTGIITTLAGSETFGFSGDGGPAASAQLYFPGGVALDAGNNVFIADTGNLRVRRVDAVTGIITTVAGNGTFGDGGPAVDAEFVGPTGAVVDRSGNLLVADVDDGRIRRIDASTGVVTTAFDFHGLTPSSLCQGPDLSSTNLNPVGVALDSSGNVLAAAGTSVCRVNAVTGIIDLVAGDPSKSGSFSGDGGPAVQAGPNSPLGLIVDSVGNILFAAREIIASDVSMGPRE